MGPVSRKISVWNLKRPRDEYFLKDQYIKSEFSKFVLKSFNIFFALFLLKKSK